MHFLDDGHNKAKEIIGEENFIGIYINSDLSICEKRDTKGLYKKARTSEIENFTGISSKFEQPNESFFEVDTNKDGKISSEELQSFWKKYFCCCCK